MGNNLGLTHPFCNEGVSMNQPITLTELVIALTETTLADNLNVMVNGQPSYNPNYVFCLYVDKAGTIWAGTWGGGVSRFDGKRWTNLTHRDGLAGDIVYTITQDRQGAMWFGTQQGVSRYKDGVWLTLGREQGINSGSIYSLAALPNGDIWAGTQGGVVRIGNGTQAPENTLAAGGNKQQVNVR